ncbi:DNA cytosine methyltransferase [Streptomyces sp. Root369]|uniref:DNA cytosine methyltransferase n=1 Tax=Streptomyces sp. Root369 TaxID=1736523 RepID=UPI000A8AE640|nr:DNA cytosine methyltransferase [Streptomyces sp. Root369]
MPYIDSTSIQWAAASKAANAPRRIRAYKHDGGDLSVMDWFCADTETEILTARGWRRYDQVEVGDMVASLDTANGRARWVPVLRMNIFDVGDAKMLRVEGKAISAFVTEGHRWPVQQRVSTPVGRQPVWQVRTSDQLNLESSVVRSAPFQTPTVSSQADALVELVGWAWTEGSYRENGGLHLSQSPTVNPAKCERIERALTALYGPPMGRAGRRVGQPAWNVADYEGTRYWRLNVVAAAPILAAAPDHVLSPDWLRTLTADQLELLIEASMLADGTTRVRNGSRDSSLSQNRQDRAEAFQFAAILAGRATSIHRWEMQHNGAPYPMWRVSLLERVTAKPLRQAVAEWTTHTGIVWCPTVEHGTWLCRRNGLVHWTGNCGAGGSGQGAEAVPFLRVARAANHWKQALKTHQLNFPGVAHYMGDIRRAPVWAWPIADIFWASPECTNWSIAKGKKRSFAKAVQGDLLSLYADMEEGQFKTEEDEDNEPTAEEEASRALMEEVPLYLRGVIERGGLIKAGVVENVTDVRAWTEWDRWLKEFHKLGYRTKVIALNSMHADPRSVHKAPQSRDRLYVAYWHKSLGRTPDWDKWLRPTAYCVKCDKMVSALQVFRNPEKDMGRYGASYDYKCPKKSCRTIVHPDVLPAAAAIDWSIKGTPIGSRPKSDDCPEGLAPNTMARIRAGVAKYWPHPGAQGGGQEALFNDQPDADRIAPFLVPTGGTWRNGPASVDAPMSTRTTVESDALVVPPILIPCEGRDGKKAMRVDEPLRTQTTRNETALAYVPFVVPMRGGGDKEKARHIGHPVHTVSAGGNHHGLAMAPGDPLLVPYYGNGQARPASEPVGTVPTHDRYGLLDATGEYDLSKVLFRMLQPKELQRAMAFADWYKILGSKRDQVRQLGNAVTPNAAEVLLCALVECITGESIDRYAMAA